MGKYKRRDKKEEELKKITDSGLGTEIAIAHLNVTYVNLERII